MIPYKPFEYKLRAYIWDSVCTVRITNEYVQSIYRAPEFTEVHQKMLTNLYKPRGYIRDFIVYNIYYEDAD